MILGIGTEAGVFLYAGLSGMTVMFAYGILSCLRRLIPHSLRMVGAEDLFFWIAASAYIFNGMYETTYGSIRWFFLLGLGSGAGAGYMLEYFVRKAGTRISSALPVQKGKNKSLEKKQKSI